MHRRRVRTRSGRRRVARRGRRSRPRGVEPGGEIDHADLSGLLGGDGVDHAPHDGVPGRILLPRVLVAPPHVRDRAARSRRPSRRRRRAAVGHRPVVGRRCRVANSGSSGVRPSPPSQRWSTTSHVVTIIITTSGWSSPTRSGSSSFEPVGTLGGPRLPAALRRSPPRHEPAPGGDDDLDLCQVGVGGRPRRSDRLTSLRRSSRRRRRSAPAARAPAAGARSSSSRSTSSERGRGAAPSVPATRSVAATDGRRRNRGRRRSTSDRLGLDRGAVASARLVDVDRGRGDGRLVGLPVLAERGRHDGDRQHGDGRRSPIAPAANVGRRLVPR